MMSITKTSGYRFSKVAMFMAETGMEITGFHKLIVEDRLEIVQRYSNIDKKDLEVLPQVLAVAGRTGVVWLEDQISG
jgi:hypothetical protein